MLTSESNYLDIDLDYLERIVFKTCLEDEIYLNSIIDFAPLDFFLIRKCTQGAESVNKRGRERKSERPRNC